MRKPLLTTDFLDRAGRHYADEEAVLTTDDTRYTYGELGERVDRFSAALGERGVEKGDRVAVLPTTATGKIRKYELKEREWDDTERMVGEG